MPGRTWIIAPDSWSLEQRWNKLIKAAPEKKEELFHPHLPKGALGDRHLNRLLKEGLAGYAAAKKSIADEDGSCIPPVRYGFRSFDRQWIIPDNRLINRPNPELWSAHSNSQIYLTALSRTSPTQGPALTCTCLIPDLDHYKGSFGGRVFPLWRDHEAATPNSHPSLHAFLSNKYKTDVNAADVMAYIAAIAAHPAYTKAFQNDLSTPGLRIPLTAAGPRSPKLLK
jgi:predicted helicase